MSLTSYTLSLTPAQVSKLRKCLERDGFEFQEKQYAVFSGKKGKLNVTVYEKGPKVLVQGKETEDFIKFTLEPEVVGEARLGYEEYWQAEMFEPHFGVDESGKGDYFGPIVVAGVYTNREIARALIDAGIMDSKRIGSAKRIRELAAIIRREVGTGFKVIRWAPARYNELYEKYQNINRMLARGHAAVIDDLARRLPGCPRVLCDQFSKAPLITRELEMRKIDINLEERTKAESDIAVAAASILARESFVDWMELASEKLEIDLPYGAGVGIVEAARDFLKNRERGQLSNLCKLHFRTTQLIFDQDSSE